MFGEKKFALVLDNVLIIAQIVFVAFSNAKQNERNTYENISNRNELERVTT